MLLSLNLLKKYIDIPKSATPKQMALKLTNSVVEVEQVIDKGKELDNIFVGRVVKIEDHPNADKLKLAEVDIKNSKDIRDKSAIQKVVCGGINLTEGMLVALAIPGAIIRWHGQGKPVKLEPAKIRGVESNGMICASDEIGLAEIFPHDQGEILDLTKFNLPVGAGLAPALGLDDIIIEIDNKSITNRPDLWSHYGIGRELATLYGSKLKELELYPESELKIKNRKLNISISIKDKDLCSRYLGCVIEDLEIAESPEWLRKTLLSLGAKPINNIVDITNYVMFELGQPLHAFDVEQVSADSSKSRRIIVRRSKKNEKLATLDEEEKKLDDSMLVIADSQKPIALAGIIGGLDSGVKENTSSIILEAATFNPIGIRRTSQRIGLRTEASNRFEKSLHPNLAEIGMRRALQLIKEIIPGAKITGIAESPNRLNTKALKHSNTKTQKHLSTEAPIIEVSLDFIQKRIGTKISAKQVEQILTSLGFRLKFEVENLQFEIEVPWWRSSGDVTCAEDIVEEIARIYGYDKIKPEMPKAKISYTREEPILGVVKKARNLLALGCGMTEVYNYSFASQRDIHNLKPDKLKIKNSKLIYLENPLSEEQEVLRPNLVAGLLKNVRDNSRFYGQFKLFEVGRVFENQPGEYLVSQNSKQKLPRQPYKIGGVIVGGKKEDNFLRAKGVVEQVVKLLNCHIVDYKEGNEYNFLKQARNVKLLAGKKEIGFLGEVKPEVLKNFEIKNRRVVIFEIDLNELIKLQTGSTAESGASVKFTPIPQYPAITRDLAIEVRAEVKWGDILTNIQDIDNLIETIEFLSVYNLGNCQKSIAFRIVYRSKDKTLTDEEAVKIQTKILKNLKLKFKAQLRG